MADPDYFTLAELKALPDCADFSDARIEAAAAYFTAIVEREIGYPLIPRVFTVTTDGSGVEALNLPHTYIRSVVSATVDGSAVDPGLLSVSNGRLRYLDSTLWVGEVDSVTVTYTAGNFEACPADVKDAVMWATRDRLLSQGDMAGVDARRTSITTDFGTTNYVLPGEKRPTGYPDLDAVIASYKRSSFYGSLSIG